MSGLRLDADLVPGQPGALSPAVRRVLAPNPGMMTGPGTNTYLVGHGSEVTIIDPGPADEAHLDAIAAAVAAEGSHITTIVVTHTHADHSPGCVALAQRTGAQILGFGPMARPGIEGHDDTFSPDATLGDGDRVTRPDHSLLALHTPGHASNHLCYLLEGEGLLFSGDHVMDGSTVVIAPLDGDMGTYLSQLRRLRARADVTAILPGHGQVIADAAAKLDAYLSHRADRQAMVAEALATAPAGRATVDELVATVYTDVRAELHKVARYSTWAILRLLAEQGHVRSTTPDTVDSTWETTSA